MYEREQILHPAPRLSPAPLQNSITELQPIRPRGRTASWAEVKRMRVRECVGLGYVPDIRAAIYFGVRSETPRGKSTVLRVDRRCRYY